MWPKRLQILAFLWGFVLVLLFIWLHLVLGPEAIVNEASVHDEAAQPAKPSTLVQEQRQGASETDGQQEDDEQESVQEQLKDDLGEDSAETAAPTTRAPASDDDDRKLSPLRLRCKPEPAVEHPPLEDNAPRLPPRAGDYEVSSEVPGILAHPDFRHMHGRLGYWPNGTCCRTMPVPLDKNMNNKDRIEAHKGFCFNTRTSESLPVDRAQKDLRSAGCRKMVYPCTLPMASVVMSFHNEHLVTLLRSIHSILNQSPPWLLKEVILVDDASELDQVRFPSKHFSRLQQELEDYVRALPKVTLVRLKERRGLMVARMEGAWRAKGSVLIFLDSHIEVTPGWLEPLLAYIKKNRKALVLPNMDVIVNDNFKFEQTAGVGPLSFTWALGQHQFFRPKNDDPAESPIVAGGHVAVDRSFFFHLGGFDLEMRLYGGEEMEVGFRTWMCGGQIKHLPCSHVGHVFRQGNYWHGQVYTVPNEVIIRNKHRVAEVWMDDFKDVFKLVSPLPRDVELGSLEQRKALRKKLGCKSFSWYLNNIAKDVRTLSPYTQRWKLNLMNIMTGGCIDTLGEKEAGKKVGVYPCHAWPSTTSTQALEMDKKTGYIRCLLIKTLCLARKPGKFAVVLRECSNKEAMHPHGEWRFVPSATMPNVGWLQVEQNCMMATSIVTPKSPFTLALEPCSGSTAQLWTWNE